MVEVETKLFSWCQFLLKRQRQGFGILGEHLQLSPQMYAQLLSSGEVGLSTPLKNSEHDKLKAQLLGLQKQRREDEFSELYEWLARFQVHEPWNMAMIVASASLGVHHLWQDLGLPERPMLTQLMNDCFPELGVRNHSAMRWKKFFYRQLCLEHGALVCRSPTCDQCSSYSECFE